MKLGNRLAVGEVVDHAPVPETPVQETPEPVRQPVQAETPAEPVVAHAVR